MTDAASRSHTGVVVLGNLSINFSGRGTRERIEQLETRLAGELDEQHRTEFLAELAIALVEADPGRARALVTHLLERTAPHLDTRGRAAALIAAGVVCAGPEESELRRVRAQQALGICTSLGERSLAETAWFVLLGALAEVGDFAGIDRELSPKHTSIGPFQDLLDGRHATWIRAMRATADGRAEDAEQLAGYGYELALAAADPDAETVLRGQLAVIRWLQGRVDELVTPLLEARQRFPEEPVWHAALAWVWFRQGASAPATEVLKGLTRVTESPRDRNWLAAVTITAEIAAAVGAKDHVRDLYAALAPFSDRLAMIGHGITCWGPVSRSLAHLAKRLGDIPAAERYLREAIATSARLGAQVWLAEGQLELAQLLRARGGLREARELSLEAATIAHRIGPPGIEVAARRLLQQLSRGLAGVLEVPEPEGDGEPEPRAPHIQMLGKFRVSDVRGVPITWRSRKAELVLKVLVSRRGTLIPREQLMDLVWPGAVPTVLANRFAVAISTVRRALDPDRAFPHDHFLELDADLVLLRFDRLTSDSGRFLELAEAEIRASMGRTTAGEQPTAQQSAAVWETLQLAQERAFAGDRDALWAEQVRRDIESTYCELAHLLASDLRTLCDWGRAAELYRRLLALDVYDERAHTGLVACLTGQGSHGLAREAQNRAHRVLGEIGIVPTARRS